VYCNLVRFRFGCIVCIKHNSRVLHISAYYTRVMHLMWWGAA